MEDWLIPLVAIVCAVGLPVVLLIVLVVRTTRTKHEERMAMIEKGIVLEEPERKVNKFNALRNGLLMIGLALGAIGGIYWRIARRQKKSCRMLLSRCIVHFRLSSLAVSFLPGSIKLSIIRPLPPSGSNPYSTVMMMLLQPILQPVK